MRLPNWSYWAILLAITLEGPIAILAASGAASAGMLNITIVFILATLGNIFGDLGWYAVGRYAKIDWLLSKQRWIKIDGARLDALKEMIKTRAVKLLFLIKVTNGMVVPVLVATGVAAVPMRIWLPVIFITNLANSAILVSIGYWGTNSLLQLRQGLEHVAIVSSLTLALVTFFSARKWLRDQVVPGQLDEPQKPEA